MKIILQICALLLWITPGYAQSPGQTVNPIIGDESFIIVFGFSPDESIDEQLRIQTHLTYVENLLREKEISKLSQKQKEKRNRVLDLLREYWTKGVFPSNFDFPNERRPCFIDRNGNICAVGYLVEKTAGIELAKKINELHQYDYLLDMHKELIVEWAVENGLTLEECALIQPTYGGFPVYNTIEVPIKTSYGISSGFLGGAGIAINMINLSKGKFTNSKTISRIGLLSGTAQVILGLSNIRKDQLEYSINNPAVGKSYKAQNNLSYINIAAGTATLITSALNLRMNRDTKDRKNLVNLYSYPGAFNELNMGLTFSRRL